MKIPWKKKDEKLEGELDARTERVVSAIEKLDKMVDELSELVNKKRDSVNGTRSTTR